MEDVRKKKQSKGTTFYSKKQLLSSKANQKHLIT
jgi:hypothetical protein